MLHVLCLTRSPVSLFHPNVAVALGHSSLRVEEWHSDAPLSTQPGIIVMTLLHGISVVLLSQPDTTKKKKKSEPHAGHWVIFCLFWFWFATSLLKHHALLLINEHLQAGRSPYSKAYINSKNSKLNIISFSCRDIILLYIVVNLSVLPICLLSQD